MEGSSRGLLHVKEGHIRWTNNETFELPAEGVIIMKTSDNQCRNSSGFSCGFFLRAYYCASNVSVSEKNSVLTENHNR